MSKEQQKYVSGQGCYIAVDVSSGELPGEIGWYITKNKYDHYNYVYWAENKKWYLAKFVYEKDPTKYIDTITHWLRKTNLPLVQGYSKEQMYLLAAYVTDWIAANFSGGDIMAKTTPKMVADKFLSSITPEK